MTAIPKFENEIVEFKLKPRNLEKEIVAFANAGGGVIYIGVDDNGAICRNKITNRNRSELITAINNCEPRPDFRIEEIDGIIALHILQGEHKPYRAPDGFYLRLGATSQKLNRDEIIKFYIDQNRIQFDTQITATVPSLTSTYYAPKNFARFRDLSGLSEDIPDLQLLENLHLLHCSDTGIDVTSALVLLFADDPQAIFPHARTIMWTMASKTHILDQQIIIGSLFNQLSLSFRYLKQQLMTSYNIDALKRVEDPEFPDYVLRELIINALIHRDYFERGGEVQIKIYPHMIEFSNPGGVLYDLAIDQVWGRSLRRNPLLAEIFQRAGYVERAGTGLLRVRDYLEQETQPAMILREEGRFFIAKLPRGHHSTDTDEPSASTVDSDRVASILNYLRSNGPVSSQQIADFSKLSTRQTRTYLTELIETGRVKKTRDGRKILYSAILEKP